MKKNILKEAETGTVGIDTYQEWVVSMWNGKPSRFTLRDDYIMSVGLGGETGEVLELLKKNVRDGKDINKDDLTKELGDVLYYLFMIAHRNNISASNIIRTNIIKLEKRYAKRDKNE